ncbi:gamma-glutamyl-gamma-aminobutyrate hydrolase family protein [Arthrobacter agilis]|uniref:gamma-glutamyl-gamma-aminobutyrate hydrolase family protein n=1 Tax=Arthrobacter agilis TaxID=37921 RepID=UPI00277F455E|nr:gamma-glutamyl-gamma-aminobutyrate hydrolase family protein [Arthrobacter agilis]MDQ0733649.1 putative glutamine amidotransferase [Arthrobacter agilis]
MAGLPALVTSRPRIGVTTYWQPASWGVWDGPAAIVPAAYIRAVDDAGGTPLLLPPVGGDAGVLSLLDGLLVIGGSDVDPSYYGAAPHPRTVSQPDRDDHDLALTRAAVAAGMPLFAICRGAQILNVALGGTLHQHLPDIDQDAERYRPAPGVFGSVDFTTTPGSIARQLLGKHASSPCYHHQGLDVVADGLRVTARAADGTVEAVEFEPPSGAGWALGVQFHPEENGQDRRLFGGFVDAAGTHAQHRASRGRRAS